MSDLFQRLQRTRAFVEALPPQAPPQAPPADPNAPPEEEEPNPDGPDVTAPNPGPASQPELPKGKASFKNDGTDKLDNEGNPKWSPNRYRQAGPGDQQAIEAYLKRNPSPSDDALHGFARSIGLDPKSAEEVVSKLAATAAGAKQQPGNKTPAPAAAPLPPSVRRPIPLGQNEALALSALHFEADTPWRDQKYGGSIGAEPARFWNVGKIHDWAQQHYPAKPLALQHLSHIFKPGSGTVAKEPFGSEEFKARADRAVMHPILVAKLPDGSHDVIDGTHRTHKAIARGDTHIQAHVVPWDKLPESARTGAHQAEAVEPVGADRKDCGVFIPLPFNIARSIGLDPTSAEGVVAKLAAQAAGAKQQPGNETPPPKAAPLGPGPRRLVPLGTTEDRANPVKGGVGDKLQPKDVDQHELAMGIAVEREHTKDRSIAQDIALDHLKENPHYYTALKKMEKGFKESLTPTQLNFESKQLGGWKRPDTSASDVGEHDEIKARAKDLGVHPKELTAAIERGQIKPLSDKHWKSLQNTDSWDTDTHEKARVLADKYGRNYDRVVKQIETGTAAAPMVVHRPGEKPYLVGGNTRLMAARAMGVRPHVVHAHLGEAIEEATDDPNRKDCGVFIPLPFNIARLFPKKATDDTEPHITMLFAGPMTPAEYGQLIAATALIGRAVAPFYVDIGSYFEFETPNDLTVAAMSPQGRGYMPVGPGQIAPRLAAIHQLLVASVTMAGLKIPNNYGKNTKKAPPHEKFLPHVTLAYLSAGQQYAGPRPQGNWLVTELECWGWEKVRLPLGHLQIDQPAPG